MIALKAEVHCRLENGTIRIRNTQFTEAKYDQRQWYISIPDLPHGCISYFIKLELDGGVLTSKIYENPPVCKECGKEL